MTVASEAKRKAAAAAEAATAKTKSPAASKAATAKASAKPATKRAKRSSKSPTTKKRAKKGGEAATSTASPTSSSAAHSSASKRAAPPPSHVLLIDNGGDTIKYGIFSTQNSKGSADTDSASTPSSNHQLPHSMPNLTAKLRHQWTVLVGDQVHTVQPTQLETQTRSMERGCITNLGNQVQVWKRMLDQLRVQVPLTTELAQTYGWNVARQAVGKAAKEETNKPILHVPQTMAVVILLSPLCPRSILEQVFTVWFHDFKFSHVGLMTTPAFGGTKESPTDCCCVVDLGWSASQVVPLYQDKVVGPVQRLPLGGRHLTGLWKYYCSYRQWNLMDADMLLQSVHEALGYVSLEFKQELREAELTALGKRSFDREFVLPDYQTTHKGFVRLTPQLLYLEKRKEEEQAAAAKKKTTEKNEKDDDDESSDNDDADYDAQKGDAADDSNEDGSDDDAESKGKDDKEEVEDVDSDEETDEQRHKRLVQQRQQEERRKRELEAERQVLLVSVERFTIPEVIFQPSDAGFSGMAGLPRVICNAIQACPRMYQSALYGCIRLIGGVSMKRNMKERLQREIRMLVPTQYKVQVEAAEDPMHDAWLQAKSWILEKQQSNQDAATLSHSTWSISRDEFEAKASKDAPHKKPWHRLLDKKIMGKLV